MTYVAFTAATLIWGTTFLFIRLGNDVVAPVWSAALRLAFAALLLTLIARVTGARFPRGEQLKTVVLFGIFNFGLNFSLLYWGELQVPSGVAAIFYSSLPLTTGLLAAVFGLERLDRRRTLVALAAMAGVATIFAGELSLDVPPLPLLAVFAAATLSGLANVLLKRIPAQGAVPVNAVGAGVGAVICLAVSTAVGEEHALPGSFEGWIPILYLTLAGSLGAYVIYTWLVAHWPATRASLVGVTAPVIAVIVGAAVKGERPSVVTLVGATIVLSSVVVGLRLPHAPAPAVRRSADPI